VTLRHEGGFSERSGTVLKVTENDIDLIARPKNDRDTLMKSFRLDIHDTLLTCMTFAAGLFHDE